MAGASKLRRRLLWAAAAGAGSIAIAVVGAMVFRLELAQLVLLGQLRALGLEAPELEVARFDRERVEVRDLRVGEDLQIPSIEADYSPTGLFASRLDALRVSGVRVRGEAGPSGVSFGRLDPLLRGRGDASPQPVAPVALPARRVEIDDAQLELTTPWGDLLGLLRADARESAPGQLDAIAELRVTHPLASFDARLSAQGSPEALSGSLALDGLAQGEVESGLSADVALSAEGAFGYERGAIRIAVPECAVLRARRLALPGVAALTQPLQLCIRSGAANALEIDPGGRLSVHLTAEPTPIAIGAGELAISGELPRLTLSGSPTPPDALTATARGGELHIAPFDVGAAGIELQASAAGTSPLPTGELRIQRLFDLATPERFGDVGASARVAPSEDGVDFEIEVADAPRNVVVDVRGSHDLALARGRADVHLRPYRFCPDGPRLTDAFPLLRGAIDDSQGTLEVQGTTRWDGDGVHADLAIAVVDLSAKTPASVIEHLNAVLELSDTGSPPQQLLSIGRIGFGLELTNGEILFQLTPQQHLAIESARFDFSGGSLETSGTVDPFADSQQLTFDVRGVDLATLFEKIDLEGLAGSGTLDGQLPIVRTGESIEIRSAELHSTPEGGVIRYGAKGSAAGVGGAQSEFGMLLHVLEDFRFTALRLTLDGEASGTVDVGVHLEGSNPAFKDGHPVEFNLHVDAQLSDLLSTEAFVYQIPHMIEERFDQFMVDPVNKPARPCVHDR